MYWQKTPRLAAGGFWECGVARRAWSKAHYEKVREERLEGLREKYDNDPLFRLTKNFRRVVRDRERRIQRLQQEGLDGALQIEG